MPSLLFHSPALSRASGLVFIGAALCLGSAHAAERPVSFNRDIRPIMSDTCFHCHGFDAKKREAKLRLDVREDALKEAESGAIPIVPGKPDESEIIRRIFTDDKDDLMPPTKAHKELTQTQKETIKRWVAEGAKYEAHWAYAPLVKPPVPANGAANPVDGFIREKLAEKKIAPSPEAPKAKLLRRLSLDLTGLPPTPEEVTAFVGDSAPDSYEKQVSRLLASPRYGERMAVWWLDVARFTDTVGFHGDQNQRIFPYRDYVINSFNANKPFDQFTIEQLAGDLLPKPTPEQLVATGYNRLNMMTREGGAQPKEYLAKYGAERVRSVAAAWFGSTFGCAECHDHKFDPIKTQDFYELQSFFADVKQWGVYADYGYTKNPELAGFNNDYPFPPEIEVDSPYLKARKQQAERTLAAHLTAARAQLTKDAKAGAAFAKWSEEVRTFLAENANGWLTPPVSAQLFKAGKPVADGEVPIGKGLALQLGRALGKGEDVRMTLQPGAGRVAALRLEALEEKAGTPTKKEKALSLAASVKTPDGKERKLAIYFADATAKEPRYDGGEEVIGVTTGWKLPREKTKRPPASIWLLEAPVQLGERDRLVVTISGDVTVPLRISVTPLGATDPLRVASRAVREALFAAADQRTAKQQQLLADTWLLSTAADRPAFDKSKQLAAAVRECRNGRAWSMVTEAVPQPLTIRVLPRGNWQDESGAIVLPSTPSFLPGRLESTEPKRLTRLDLAHYICSKENPITARAVMNRLWAQFYGNGLSMPLDDLGSQGEMPSHPELLEWLASEFRDSWDFKKMITLMVTSATYRQSSSLRPELREADPANRLLASQNPRRLEAEFVRDNALFIAGVLNTRDIGGPSVEPYQPEGYYEALQFPNREYAASTGPEQWRRGVYMHWQRTFLHPMLANFDAPARDECAAQRTVSNTPQQALTLLNDPTFVEAAKLLASRALDAKAGNDDERLDRVFQLAVARPAKDKEKASLKEFLAGQREEFRSKTADTEKLLKIGYAPPPKGDPIELAAWTSVCRVVLNSQEVITRY
ncbi:MAG: PSD1 and planctomycete cytochrome C domain-containing protein [Chthoniobacteraceae bacterium]